MSFRLDGASRYVAQRFAVKVAIIVAFAALQAHMPWGFSRALAMMFWLSAALSCVIALANHESFPNRILTHWDEVVGFLLLAILVQSLLV